MMTEETPPEMWSAVARQSAVWRLAPVVARFNKSLPWNAPVTEVATGAGTVPSMLQSLVAGAGGMMHPLRLGSVVPMLLSQDFFSDEAVPEDDLATWLESAAQVEACHTLLLAWVRSRLPGYPILRAPQLAEGTTFSESDTFSFRFPWTLEERRWGLQYAPRPPELGKQLEAPIADDFGDAALDLAKAFKESTAWREFEEAHSALNLDAKQHLSFAKAELRRRVAPDRVDAHEEGRLQDRNVFREHETATIVDALAGRAGRYAHAFTAIDELLTLVLCDVFGELTCRGGTRELDVLDLVFPDARTVEFTNMDPDWHVNGGEVVWLKSSAIRDAVRIEAAQFSFNQLESKVTCRARILTGSGETWMRPAS